MTLTFLDWSIVTVYPVDCMAEGVWTKPFVRGAEGLAIAERDIGRMPRVSQGECNLGQPE